MRRRATGARGSAPPARRHPRGPEIRPRRGGAARSGGWVGGRPDEGGGTTPATTAPRRGPKNPRTKGGGVGGGGAGRRGESVRGRVGFPPPKRTLRETSTRHSPAFGVAR